MILQLLTELVVEFKEFKLLSGLEVWEVLSAGVDRIAKYELILMGTSEEVVVYILAELLLQIKWQRIEILILK